MKRSKKTKIQNKTKIRKRDEDSKTRQKTRSKAKDSSIKNRKYLLLFHSKQEKAAPEARGQIG